VIGHDSAEVTDLATELLVEAGYEVIVAHDGIQALLQIEQRRPVVAILDVGLPKMFGFEIIEVVRRDSSLANVKLLLIAAIYDKTRYKRNPQSLYGADDYIEKHMIPENLVEKVNALVGASKGTVESTATATAATATGTSATATKAAPAPAPTPTPAKPVAAPAAAPAAAGAFDESTLSPQEKEDHEKAKRLARIIASDIALYNADALVEGVKSGNPLQALERDIEEGRKLYVERVPANMRGKVDYLGIALEDLFNKKRKELGLAV
jgi:CheY-like chemotaxis protein